MLQSHHGAATLGKRLRQPILRTMKSESHSKPGSLSPVSASSNSTQGSIKGARAISGHARPRALPAQQKTWHQGHPIVFKPNPSLNTPRRNTSSAVGIEEGEEVVSRSATECDVLDPGSPSTLAVQGVEQGQPGADSSADNPDILDDAYQDPKYSLLPKQSSLWKMPEELFRAAKGSPFESPSSYWSHTLYRGPTLDDSKNPTKVIVHYCTSKNTTDRVLNNYFRDVKVIGFDIEWHKNAHKSLGPKRNVSLIQIASEERVALFHIALFSGSDKNDLVAPSLRKILEDPEVTKVGVAIKGDCTRIKNNLGVEPKGLFELSHLYKLVKFSESKEFKLINKKLVSLAIQVQEHLHLPMFKGGDVRSSDWSKALNLAQIRYAASDSYAGVHLYQTMEMKRKALDPTPPRPYHAELNIPIRVSEGIEIPTDDPAEEAEAEESEAPAPAKQKTRKQRPYISPLAEDTDPPPLHIEESELEPSLSTHPYICLTTQPNSSIANYKSKAVSNLNSTTVEAQIEVEDSLKSIAGNQRPSRWG